MRVDWPLVRLLCHQKLLREDLTVTQATRDAGVNRGVFAEFLAGTRPALAVHNLFASSGGWGSMIGGRSVRVRAVLLPPNCPPCRKRAWPTEGVARYELAYARTKKDTTRQERSVYECPYGNGWHITSKERFSE